MRANGVQDKTGWQVIRSGDLCRADGLFMTLGNHDLAARIPQLQTRRRMDGIIDAAVLGVEAAQQGVVRRVDNAIGIDSRDITLPEDDTWNGGGR